MTLKKEMALVLMQISSGILLPNINKVSINEIYEKYKTDFQPSESVFLIWPVIYSFLLYGFYKQKNEWDQTSEKYFQSVTVSNILWVYLWTKDKIVLSNLCFLPLCFSLYQLIDRNINEQDLILQNTLSIYLCWTLVASTLNFASVLKYKLKFKSYKKITGFLLGFSQIFLVIINQTISSSKRETFKKNTNSYPLVGFISLIALKNKSKDINNELFFYFLCCLFSTYKQIK